MAAEYISYIIEHDGDAWVAHRSDFVDLQESLAGFGDTPLEALVDLLELIESMPH